MTKSLKSVKRHCLSLLFIRSRSAKFPTVCLLQWCPGVVVKHADSCFTMKTSLVRKATGNHLIKSTSLEKLRALSLVSATREIEYATQFFYICFYKEDVCLSYSQRSLYDRNTNPNTDHDLRATIEIFIISLMFFHVSFIPFLCIPVFSC